MLTDDALRLTGDCIGSGGTGLTLRTEDVPPSTVRAALGPSGVGLLEPGCGPVPPPAPLGGRTRQPSRSPLPPSAAPPDGRNRS